MKTRANLLDLQRKAKTIMLTGSVEAYLSALFELQAVRKSLKLPQPAQQAQPIQPFQST